MSLLLAFFAIAATTAFARHSTNFAARNLHTIQSIYNLTVYPNNAPIVAQGASAVPPGLFAQNATGRVTPLGNFTGFDDSVEYFFVLAPTPQANNGTAIYQAQVVEFTSGCPSIATSVVYLHTGKVDNTTGELLDPNEPTATLKEIAFWRFDDDGLVTQYDAWIPTLQLWQTTASGVNTSDPSVQHGLIEGALCPAIQQRCTGENQQYDDLESCIEVLTAKPFGSNDEIWGDNIVCRNVHVILTQVRPEVHCPHVGPNGGNGPDNFKCVNFDFHDPSFYTDDDILYQGEQFMC